MVQEESKNQMTRFPAYPNIVVTLYNQRTIHPCKAGKQDKRRH